MDCNVCAVSLGTGFLGLDLLARRRRVDRLIVTTWYVRAHEVALLCRSTLASNRLI